MKILITGGAGFIGSHLAERLLLAGTQVRVLDNLSTGKRDNLPSQHRFLDFVQGDIREKKTVSDCVRGMDAVVHLAAVASVQASIDQPMETHQTNFDGTLNLLEASRIHGVRRLLYASSAAIYGDAATVPVSEETVPHPLSPYAVDKLSGEYYLRYYFSKFDPRNVVSVFQYHGPRQDPSRPIRAIIFSWIAAGSTGHGIRHGSQTRDFACGRSRRFACPRVTRVEGVGGVFNVGTANAIPATVIDRLEKLSGEIGVSTKRRLGDIRHSCADVSRLKQIFGSAPATPFDQGLKKLLESLNT